MAYTRKQLRAMKVQDINDKIVAACAAIAEDLEGDFGSGAGMSTPLLNTAFGSPSTVGGGFSAVYRDTSGNKTYHVCVCTDIDGWFAYEASPVAGS